MARDISCDFCQSEPAFGIWSEVADGTTVAVGKDCVPAFLGGLAQAFGLLSEQPAASEGKPDGQDSGTGEGDGVTEVSEGKPRPRRSRKAKAEQSYVDESGHTPGGHLWGEADDCCGDEQAHAADTQLPSVTVIDQ